MYKYALSFFNEYVEITTYLTKNNLYGKIINVTPYDVALLRDHIEKSSSDNYTLYIPLSSIISIKKI
ncbi:MAG: hypothetical protein ACRDA3_04825 [Peptostreptococcaceae bacterium]